MHVRTNGAKLSDQPVAPSRVKRHESRCLGEIEERPFPRGRFLFDLLMPTPGLPFVGVAVRGGCTEQLDEVVGLTGQSTGKILRQFTGSPFMVGFHAARA